MEQSERHVGLGPRVEDRNLRLCAVSRLAQHAAVEAHQVALYLGSIAVAGDCARHHEPAGSIGILAAHEDASRDRRVANEDDEIAGAKGGLDRRRKKRVVVWNAPHCEDERKEDQQAKSRTR